MAIQVQTASETRWEPQLEPQNDGEHDVVVHVLDNNKFLTCERKADGKFSCLVRLRDMPSKVFEDLGNFDAVIKEPGIKDIGTSEDSNMVNVYTRYDEPVECHEKRPDGSRLLVCAVASKKAKSR